MPGPLEGIKVIDFTDEQAGPECCHGDWPLSAATCSRLSPRQSKTLRVLNQDRSGLNERELR